MPKKETLTKPVLKKQAKKPASGLEKWRQHLKSYRDENPDVSLKNAMINAKATYKR
jgi:hypothetical protein